MENAISVDEAKDWLCRWRDNQGTYNTHHRVKGFNIPINDLVHVQAEQGVDHVRAYLGVTPDLEEKIVLVAVDSAGNDMIDESAGQYIYDMITPCPPDCGSGALSDLVCVLRYGD